MQQRPFQEIFEALSRSSFRARFRLGTKERSYIDQKGLETIRSHAVDFVTARLAPARPKNDGRQTPMKNHPVFIAQHATATCCRGCLCKWHHIPRGRPLSGEEITFVVNLIMAWLERQLSDAAS